MKIAEIAQFIGGEPENCPANLVINGCAKLEEAAPSDISFLANSKYSPLLSTTSAGAVLVEKDQKIPEGTPVIRVKNPYLAYVLLLEKLYPAPRLLEDGVSDSAYVHPEAEIGKKVSIAPGVYIGKKVVIGDGTRIFPNAVILDNVKIGNDCVLYPNIVVREECVLGDRVILQPGAVIGSDGFGFAPVPPEGYHKIPQVGKVILEHDVEIGANTAIDRATTGSTVIKAGTKIDNLVQIGHNVVVGRNTVIAGVSGIAGSTKIGDWCQIGGQAAIAGHLNIGDQVNLAGDSGVMSDLESGKTYFGIPVREMSKAMRIEASLNKLPELLKRVKKLERILAEREDGGEKEK
jgi:UDP-3-O-[3-hydroxymyristoyl] glucosamine N-acyltransferase